MVLTGGLLLSKGFSGNFVLSLIKTVEIGIELETAELKFSA